MRERGEGEEIAKARERERVGESEKVREGDRQRGREIER